MILQHHPQANSFVYKTTGIIEIFGDSLRDNKLNLYFNVSMFLLKKSPEVPIKENYNKKDILDVPHVSLWSELKCWFGIPNWDYDGKLARVVIAQSLFLNKNFTESLESFKESSRKKHTETVGLSESFAPYFQPLISQFLINFMKYQLPNSLLSCCFWNIY